ncbi:MAG: GntR family transcriptional regulator [Butyricicoccus sp.]
MLQLDRRDPRPVYEQVVDGIEQLIARGVLEADSQLPSVRQMAIDLSVNPNTVQKAYSELLSRGVIYSVRGRGNFVAGEADVRGQKLAEICSEMVHLLQRAKELGATREEREQMLRSLKEVIEDD